MKKVKGKYIRLTEQDLNNIINEVVEKKINSLLEYYAINRSRFKERILNQVQQIIENWCLVSFCSLTNNDINRCKEHWRNELGTALQNVARPELKRNNSFEYRYKLIKSVFDEEDLCNDPNRILLLIRRKFTNEGIDYKSKEVKTVCDMFIDNIDDIIKSMADSSYNDYVETL